MADRIIMVMGIQRSGGSTIVRSFMKDKDITVYKHGSNDAIYKNNGQHLREASELIGYFSQIPGAILIEPKSETKFRSVLDVLNEFASLDVHIIWNYRDPFEVYCSRLKRYPKIDWMKDENRFIEMWNDRNGKILEAIDLYPDKITIIKLEDIIKDKNLYRELCLFMGLKGEYGFYRDGSSSKASIDDSLRQTIKEGTASVYASLEDKRRFRPSRQFLKGIPFGSRNV